MQWRAVFGPAVVGLGLGLAVVGCGDDGGGGNGGGGASEAATPDVDAVSTCLTDAGLEVSSDSVLTDEAREALGIEDGLSIVGSDDLTGLGSITWYVDADTAREADEAGAAVRTDEVARGVVGRAAWDFMGSDAAVEAIEGCL